MIKKFLLLCVTIIISLLMITGCYNDNSNKDSNKNTIVEDNTVSKRVVFPTYSISAEDGYAWRDLNTMDLYAKNAPNGRYNFDPLYVGRKGLNPGTGDMGKFYVAILSFNTSSIPDTATITGLRLSLGIEAAEIDPQLPVDPDEYLQNNMRFDIAKPSGFSNYYALQEADYNASSAASIPLSDIFVDPWAGYLWFPAAALPHVNVKGKTQIRIRITGWVPGSYNYSIKVYGGWTGIPGPPVYMEVDWE